jgi:asparagine synthase (glutamine-hydrolysing)
VINCEIYNFPEMKKILLARGHHFQSASDTEVIVHGYEEWGGGVVEKLEGMFALGLWDQRAETLLLARDRFGKKPLYYHHAGLRVRFASEIKALRELPGLALTLNPAAIDCYLHHLGTTQEQCIYREVRKVKPAHYEVFTPTAHRVIRYWQPPFGHKLALRESEWIERIETALRQAIQKRLISDVPLGAFLSGGVDSSLVVALMSQVAGQPVKTFSIGFAERDFSELHFARQVACRYQTDHQEIVLKPDVLGILPALVWEYGEPFADSSAIPTYYVSQGARQFVTVALSGDGGDEMFGGYDIARAAWYAFQYDRWTPAFFRRRWEDFLLNGAAADRYAWLHKLKTLAVQAHADPAVRYSYSMAFGPRQKADLYTAEFKSLLAGQPARQVFENWQAEIKPLNLIDQHLFMTMVTRLANDYLVKVDVAAMKVSLELRSPFLDTGVAELAGSMDPFTKVRLGRQKYLLKKLAERHLPREVIYRKKRGFALPLKHWLRQEFAPLLKALLPGGCLVGTGWFRGDTIQRLIDEHMHGQYEHTHRLWALLCLELWFRLFVAGTLRPTDSLK